MLSKRALEVPVAEALVAGALDDLVEERPRALVGVHRLRLAHEDWQHVLVVLSVEEDLEALELVQVLLDVRDAELGEALGSAR